MSDQTRFSQEELERAIREAFALGHRRGLEEAGGFLKFLADREGLDVAIKSAMDGSGAAALMRTLGEQVMSFTCPEVIVSELPEALRPGKGPPS